LDLLSLFCQRYISNQIKPDMKKILLIMAIVAGLSAAHAQEGIRLGAKGSFYSNWLFNKNVSDQNSSLDYASSFGPSFGIQAIFMFKETYGLSAEIIYATHNQKYDGYSEGENNTFTNEINLGYLDIPVLFRVSSAKGPYFELGPQFSLLMGAKETLEYSKIINGQGEINPQYSGKDVKDDFAGFGVAGILGFGIDIKLTDMINLTTGLRFGYMFTDATTEYSEIEKDALEVKNKLSRVSKWAHKNDKNDFEYKKSNRAFGGLQLGIQFLLDK